MLEPAASTHADERITRLQSQLREREELLNHRTAELAARDLRIRLLEEALRVLQADKYGASREKLGVAPGQRGLFNEVEATLELTEMVGVEPRAVLQNAERCPRRRHLHEPDPYRRTQRRGPVRLSRRTAASRR